MDIDLGKGFSGREAAAQILSHRTLPIVFLTSHHEREMVEKVRGITRYGYVIKDSGDFVLQSSIEMAFELFEAHQQARQREESLRTVQSMAHIGNGPGTIRKKDLVWSEEMYRMFGHSAGRQVRCHLSMRWCVHCIPTTAAEWNGRSYVFPVTVDQGRWNTG